jgi:type VI secretion system secreted protein Hcp
LTATRGGGLLGLERDVMERLKLSGKTLALIAVAILAAAGTYAVASIPDSGGVITACWDHNNDTNHFGTLRVIDPSLPAAGHSNYEYSCLTNETQITWNQQGPTGPAGPQGPAGLQGVQGPQGPQPPETFLSFTGGVRNAILLSLPGVTGDSTIKGHKGNIELQSMSFAASKPKTGEIIIVKHFDKSSPTLFKAVATGKHFPTATITHRKAGGGQQEYLTFSMTNVSVTSVKNVGSPSDPRPQEQLTLTFGKVNVEFLGGNHHTSVQLTPHQFSLP